MNLFKIGRGNFWGIIIPGGFLFLNLFIIFSLDSIQTVSFKSELTYSFVIIGVLISYILGYLLRLIKPEYLETFSINSFFELSSAKS